VSVKVVKNLCVWYEKNARDLPWRRSSDPYRIWLSEIMLQQTQVATVIPYFYRFLQEFPSVFDLADAPLESVLRLWAGLGYYSRARNLHRGAQALAVRLREGLGFPKTRDEWLEIPGVGPYTAGAICSIAFNLPEPLVDGNVVRVLSRMHALETLDSKKSEIWELATRWVRTPGAVPRILNQALMELGARVCRPGQPDCSACPVRGFCRGKKDPTRYPPKKKRAESLQVRESKWILLRKRNRGSEVLLLQNQKGRWREGLWDFPDSASVKLEKAILLDQFPIRYVVTRHRVEREHSLFRIEGVRSVGSCRPTGGRWFNLNDLPGVPAPVKKVFDRIRQRNFE